MAESTTPDLLADVYRLAANMNVKMPAGVHFMTPAAAFRAGALAMRGAVADAIAAQSEAEWDARRAAPAGALAPEVAPIGYTWTYMGMRHFTGHREVAEQIAATATELGEPVMVQPVCIAGAAIGKGGAV